MCNCVTEFTNPVYLTVHAKNFSISCAVLKFVQFRLIFVGCHGNSLGSLEILDSIFEVADRKNPTIHAKIVSIYCKKRKVKNRHQG